MITMLRLLYPFQPNICLHISSLTSYWMILNTARAFRPMFNFKKNRCLTSLFERTAPRMAPGVVGRYQWPISIFINRENRAVKMVKACHFLTLRRWGLITMDEKSTGGEGVGWERASKFWWMPQYAVTLSAPRVAYFTVCIAVSNAYHVQISKLFLV